MKTKLLGALAVLTLALTTAAIPVKAATDYTYKADAKADYADNYSEIYGVSFNITPVAGADQYNMYMCGIYIDNGTEAGVGNASAAYASSGLVGYATSFGTEAQSVDAGESGTIDAKYVSSTPLFTEGTSMAVARVFAPGAAAVTVNSYTWLDKDGNKFVPSEKKVSDTPKADTPKADTPEADTPKADSPKTGDTGNMIPALILLVSCVGVASVYGVKRKNHIK